MSSGKLTGIKRQGLRRRINIWDGGVRVQMDAENFAKGFSFFIEVSRIKSFQLSETFFCPIKPEIGMIKRMHDHLLSTHPKIMCHVEFAT
jgi:hypothetical protein